MNVTHAIALSGALMVAGCTHHANKAAMAATPSATTPTVGATNMHDKMLKSGQRKNDDPTKSSAAAAPAASAPPPN